MVNFSEAWLADYQRRRTVIGSPAARAGVERAAPISPDRYSFSLLRPTELLNVSLRQHWTVRRRLARGYSEQIAKALEGQPLPVTPWAKARLVIWRRSVRFADSDGCVGGCKALIDTLLPRSKTHPWGLGIMVDDSPGCLDLIVWQRKVSRLRDQGTDVLIERFG